MEQIMTSVAAQSPSVPPSPAPATVADIMQRSMTTIDQYDHVAAAAYLMKHAATTALIVADTRTGQTVGIITERDVADAVADGKDVNEVRVHAAMTTRRAVIDPTTSVRDAAKIMTRGHFRHLPVVGRDGLLGTVDINEVCQALIGADEG
jgi:CBS domain-containing protein